MISLKFIEKLRSKEELIAYFKRNGINITEEQIAQLKQKYENICEDKNKLTLKQLDNVAGGLKFITCATHESFEATKNLYQTDINDHKALAISNNKNGGVIAVFDGRDEGFTIYDAENQNTKFNEKYNMIKSSLATLNKTEFDNICDDLTNHNVSIGDLRQFKGVYEVLKIPNKGTNNKENISINKTSSNAMVKDTAGFLFGGLFIAGVSLAVGFSSDDDKNKK